MLTKKTSLLIAFLALLALMVLLYQQHVIGVATLTSFTRKELNTAIETMTNKGHYVSGTAIPSQELEKIWNYLYKKQYKCTESEYLGGRPGDEDGLHDFCIEKRFWPLRSNPKHKCLMYSFGGRRGLSFEGEIVRKGCEVHVFDPSNVRRPDQNVAKAGVKLHKIGFAHEDTDLGFKNEKMRTLKTLLKELGHTNRHLDYLKIDVDGISEDVLLEELLSTGMHRCVRQFAMELHILGPLTDERRLIRCRRLYTQMQQLNKDGWKLYNTTENFRVMKNMMHANYTQMDSKIGVVSTGAKLLWEVAFVNFDVKGPCILK